MKSLHTKSLCISLAFALLSAGIGSFSAKADSSVAALPFSQDWSDPALISVNNIWSGVYAVIGYTGSGLTTVIDKDPQTILKDDTTLAVHVIANAANPNTNLTGGVAEFDSLANPVVALQGSGSADAPYLKIAINTVGVNNVRVAYDVKDIDGSADNAVQQVALHYRIGSTGSFTNLPSGYIADATTGPSLAEKVTHISVLLPVAAENQPVVELRIMTVNATGNDEWVGIDNISITANYTPTGFSLSSDSILENKPAGTIIGILTGNDLNETDTHTFALVNSASCNGAGVDNIYFSITGDTLITAAVFDYESNTSYSICVQVTDNNGLSKTGPAHAIQVLDVADETPPAITINSSSAQSDPTNVSPVNFTVVFSEPIDASTFTSEDITLSGTAGATTAIIAEIAPNDGTTFNIAVSGMSISGSVIASISAGVVRDPSDNANIASTSSDNIVIYDIASPVLLSFTRQTPSGMYTAMDTLIFHAVFDEGVSNVDATDFSVNATSAAGVTNVDRVSANMYDVTVSGGDLVGFNGIVGLDFSTLTDIQDLAGNPFVNVEPVTDETYTLDNLAPDVIINSKPASPTNSTNAEFTFSSADGTAVFTCDLDHDGFIVCPSPTSYVGLGEGTHTLSVRATDAADNSTADTYSWTIDITAPDVSIDAHPAAFTNNADASFGFSSADHSVTFACDLDNGGLAPCASPASCIGLSEGVHAFLVKATDSANNSSSTETYTWTIDLTEPVVESFTRQSPSGTAANADTLVFRVTFGEAVAYVGTTDFSVNGNTTVSVTGVSEVNASVYDVTVSGGDLANFNGAVGLNFNSPNIQDLAGNIFVGAEPPVDETYAMDNIDPAIVSFTRQKPSNSRTTGDVFVFRVTFSEDVRNVDLNDFKVHGGAIAAVTNVTAVSASVYDVTLSGGNLPNFTGIVGLDFNSPSISDLAGNILVNAEPGIDDIYTVFQPFHSAAANDGWVLESSEFSSLASTKSTAGTLRVGDDARNRQYRSLLYFDTARLPDKAVISKATMKLKKAGVLGAPSFTTHGDLVADMKKGFFGFAPLELTDFNAAGEPINTAGKFTTGDSLWYQLTLSPVNFKYINRYGVTQFRLRFVRDDDNDRIADFILFFAGDAADPLERPQLIVEYSVP